VRVEAFSYSAQTADNGGVMNDPAIIHFPIGRSRRVIIIQVDPEDRAIDVFLWPHDPKANLDRRFATSGRACDYACKISIQHHFPIKSPGQPDEWMDAMVHHYRVKHHGRR